MIDSELFRECDYVMPENSLSGGFVRLKLKSP